MPPSGKARMDCRTLTFSARPPSASHPTAGSPPAIAPGERGLASNLPDLRLGFRGRREVEDPVARPAAPVLDRLERLLQLRVEAGVAEVSRQVLHGRGELARTALRRRREL